MVHQRVSLTSLLITSAVVGASMLPVISPVAYAVYQQPTKPTTMSAKKTTGMAKVTLSGTVVSATDTSLAVHVTKVSANAKKFQGKDVSLPLTKKTKITKAGKAMAAKMLVAGTKVKIFAIYDRKADAIVKTRWVKVLVTP